MRSRCAWCGRRIQLERGPAERAGVGWGAQSVPWARGEFHPECVPAKPRTYTACTYKIPRKSERFMMRLTIRERGELNRLQDLTGAKSVAGVLRALWRAELARLERKARSKS